MSRRPPILGFCAYSGAGKTTLLKKLLPELARRGLRTGVIKHAHHAFDIDQPGKDSHELRKAGAKQMLVSSRRRWALINELEEAEREASLPELIELLDHEALDLILVEGFKNEPFPKIELHRHELGKPLLHPQDPQIIAFATNSAQQARTSIPALDLNRPEAIAEFIVEHCLAPSSPTLKKPGSAA